MYFVYVDESGSLDTKARPENYLYVLGAVTLYEHRWHGFEKTLNRKKWELINTIKRAKQGATSLELAHCEIKSTSIRIPKERKRHPFLDKLTDVEVDGLVELFYQQLKHHNMRVFAVVVDKRCLKDFMDTKKMHRKAWELLLERIERYIAEEHGKHQAVLITDDISRDRNRSLAMKHAYLQSEGTSSGQWLRHIAEMPLFVRSELSNGVQLADLVAYNVYRCFRGQEIDYPHFLRILPHLWTSTKTHAEVPDGLIVFPPESSLVQFRSAIGTRRAGLSSAGP